MADIFDEFKETKTITPIIFAVDASDAMIGDRIKSANEAIKDIVSELVGSQSFCKSLIEYSVLRFASGAQWLTNGFVIPDETNVPAVIAGGHSDLGCALTEINKKLSKKGFLDAKKKYAAPLVCFITTGKSTDNYRTHLKKLKRNKWYKRAIKIAAVIGDDDNCNIMTDICGDIYSVMSLKSSTLLKMFLRQEISSKTKLLVKVNYCITINSEKTTGRAFEELFLERRQKRAEVLDDVALNTLDDKPADGKIGEDDFLSNDSLPVIPVPPGRLAGGTFIPCSSCGESIGIWHKFCPNCGTPAKTENSACVNVNQVQFSAVVPKQLVKGEYTMIDISVYEDTYRHIVDKIIANADNEVKEVIASPQDVVENTMIRIVLSSPDLDISDCDETQKWRGKYLTYSFPVEIPSDYAKKQILFIAAVYFNEIIATKLKFVVSCTSTREQKLQLMREDVLTAFISYASQDRGRVATIIQGMKKARPDMDIFFDVESLRSGEDWERVLRSEIEKRDVLFLCWSHFAKESKWVETEWRYALTNKGLESIEPIPLVSPSECPPPDELKSKHFNDKALLYKEH